MKHFGYIFKHIILQGYELVWLFSTLSFKGKFFKGNLSLEFIARQHEKTPIASFSDISLKT